MFIFFLLDSSFHSYIIVCYDCKLIMHSENMYVSKVACNECSAKMKKCLVCGELITEKVTIREMCSQNLSYHDKVSTSPTNTDIVTRREESWRLRYEHLITSYPILSYILDTRIWRSSIFVRFVWSVRTTSPSPPAVTRPAPTALRPWTSATTADNT